MSHSKGWKRTRLKYVAGCNLAVLPEDTSDEYEFIYVDIGNVTQGSMNVASPPIKFGDAPSRARRLAQPGDTVVSTVRTYLRAVATVPEIDDPLVFSTGFAILQPLDSVDPRYLSWYLQGDEFVSRVEASSKGVSYPAITAPDLIALDLYLPSHDEQRAIADHLDRETVQIDRLIEEQRRLVEMLRGRRVAVIDRALTPPDDAAWVRSALKYMLAGIDQGVSPQAEAGLAEADDSWGVLKAGCANRGIFRQTEHKRLPDDFDIDHRMAVSIGDLIVSRANGTPAFVGSAAIVERLDYNLILSDKLFRLRPAAHVDARFLMWVLNSRWYRTQVHGSISGAEGLANNLPLSALRSFEMRYPDLPAQQSIARYLDEQTAKIDLLIAEAERVIELAYERRSALVTAAVTGEIGEVA